MPTATAVWLIDNTSLTFKQVADFCKLHKLEIEGIANEDVAAGVKGFDPVANGQLSLEMIEKCQKDPNEKLILVEMHENEKPKRRKQARYTPVSRRRDRPNAIAWLLRNHPEISDGQTGKLIGTTKSTINTVRDKSHWNTASIKPVDPVSLGLCTQKTLDEIVTLAGRRKERRDKEKLRAQKRAEKERGLNAESQIDNEADESAYKNEDELTDNDYSENEDEDSFVDNENLEQNG